MSPLISILIPVYNRSDLIRETIQSALDQTYENTEIIVVDNCSTDSTWAILCELVQSNSKIKIYRNSENIGPVKNWKVCIGYATGEYSKILWSDDLMHPTFLACCIEYIQDPSIAFVYSSVKIFQTGLQDSAPIFYQRANDGKFSSKLYIEEALLKDNIPYSPGCAIFRTVDLKNNFVVNIENQINTNFSDHAIGPDLLIFLNTANQYNYVAHVKESLSYFRSHKGAISVESNSFKLLLMYNIAKSYFVANNELSSALSKKFNSALLIFYFKNFKNLRNLGILTVAHFYPTRRKLKFRYSYIFARVFVALKKRFNQ